MILRYAVGRSWSCVVIVRCGGSGGSMNRNVGVDWSFGAGFGSVWLCDCSWRWCNLAGVEV